MLNSNNLEVHEVLLAPGEATLTLVAREASGQLFVCRRRVLL